MPEQFDPADVIALVDTAYIAEVSGLAEQGAPDEDIAKVTDRVREIWDERHMAQTIDDIITQAVEDALGDREEAAEQPPPQGMTGTGKSMPAGTYFIGPQRRTMARSREAQDAVRRCEAGGVRTFLASDPDRRHTSETGATTFAAAALRSKRPVRAFQGSDGRSYQADGGAILLAPAARAEVTNPCHAQSVEFPEDFTCEAGEDFIRIGHLILRAPERRK